jgi:carboxymethylenebutenolidase
MTVVKKLVRFGANAEFSGLIAHLERASAPTPGIVVIQEAWGVDAHIEDVTERFARAGYVALAPVIYARGGELAAPLETERMGEVKAFMNELPPGKLMDAEARQAVLQTKPEELAGRIGESLNAMFAVLAKTEENVRPVVAAARHLRSDVELTRGQKIASVGFCMGGLLSARLASEDPELAGAVVFYGVAPPDEVAKRIRCPILGFYGSKDARVLGTLAGFEKVAKESGLAFEKHVFEGADHAFFNDTRPVYDPHAARHAFARTLTFFAERLD